jgi:Holliday junction DNA helicase RuvA
VIGRIQGTLLEKRPPMVLVDANGIGYEVDVSMSTFYQLPAAGAVVTLFTHLLVREDAHQLYGFATEAERALFRQLIKIAGVGARTALAVLSGMSVADLRQAVAGQDTARLTKVPGIGKKTAERLVLELRDKLKIEATAAAAPAGLSPGGDIVNALIALGYNEREASWALGQLDAGMSVAEGIRQALKLLSKG